MVIENLLDLGSGYTGMTEICNLAQIRHWGRIFGIVKHLRELGVQICPDGKLLTPCINATSIPKECQSVGNYSTQINMAKQDTF